LLKIFRIFSSLDVFVAVIIEKIVFLNDWKGLTMKKGEISKSDAVDLLAAVGIKTAGNWSTSKLTEEIRKIGYEYDIPEVGKRLESVINLILDSETEDIVVVDDKKEVQSSEDKEMKEKKKKIVKKVEKKTRFQENSIDFVTLSFLKEKPISLDALVVKLMKRFPNSDEDTMKRMTSRRLGGHLQKKFDVTIEKNEKGLYFVS